jgi:predicted ester cyclase
MNTALEAHKNLARRLYEEAYGTGRLEVLEEVASDAFFCRNPAGVVRGVQGIRDSYHEWKRGLSDLTYVLEDQVAEGDKVVNRLTISGVHTGDLMGVPPTGKHVVFEAVTIFRIEDDKIVQAWGSADVLTLLREVGVLDANLLVVRSGTEADPATGLAR